MKPRSSSADRGRTDSSEIPSSERGRSGSYDNDGLHAARAVVEGARVLRAMRVSRVATHARGGGLLVGAHFLRDVGAWGSFGASDLPHSAVGRAGDAMWR